MTSDAGNLLREAMDAQGIKDNELRAGLAAIIGGESAFKPVAEIGYRNTSNTRIRSIFAAAKALTDAQLDVLKKSDAQFFEAMYGRFTAVGKTLGNTQAGDGFLFRGRGLLQLTGRGNYTRYGKLTGHPELVDQPELANEPKLAAVIAVAYIRDRYHSGGFEAMKRAVGNSFGVVDDRKNALFRQYLADGTFNAPTGAQPGEEPVTTKVPAAPTITDDVVIDWGSLASQVIKHETPIIKTALEGGASLVLAEIPFGSIVAGFIVPKLVDQYVDLALTAAEGWLDGQSITIPGDGVGGFIAHFAQNLIAEAESTLLGWLDLDINPLIVEKIATPEIQAKLMKLKPAKR